MSVSVLIPCRDGEATLSATLDSLRNQSITATVIIADDASVDRTPDIIKEYGAVHVRYTRREPRSYDRVAVLVNMAYRAAPLSDYYMISGCHHRYPPDYLETLITWMQRDKVALVSGYTDTYADTYAPRGSGRVMSASLMRQLMPLPPNLAWDSWMLYRMDQLGIKYRMYPIKTELIGHRRKTVYSYGHAEHLLGSPLIATLGRIFFDITRGESPRLATSILVGQLTYRLKKVPQMPIASYIRGARQRRMKQRIMRYVSALECKLGLHDGVYTMRHGLYGSLHRLRRTGHL